jgi:hypothetical protein
MQTQQLRRAQDDGQQQSPRPPQRAPMRSRTTPPPGQSGQPSSRSAQQDTAEAAQSGSTRTRAARDRTLGGPTLGDFLDGYERTREHTRDRLRAAGFAEVRPGLSEAEQDANRKQWQRLHNAYAHAYGAAYFAYHHGEPVGRSASFWQEVGNNRDADWFKDLYNDSVGLALVAQNPDVPFEEIDEMIWQEIFTRGGLILDAQMDRRMPSQETIRSLQVDDILLGRHGANRGARRQIDNPDAR